MKYPVLEINPGKIRDNAARVKELLRQAGIPRLVGVAKGTCAHPAVVRAMLEGGVDAIGDSRVQNLEKLRQAGVSCEMVLLRAPGPSQVSKAVEVADVSLGSDPGLFKLLGREAERKGKIHRVILMVDMGDLREGVWPDEAPEVARKIRDIPGLVLWGIGTNMACYGGVIPTREKMKALLEVKEKIEDAAGVPIEVISGGNSANMRMVLAKDVPEGITELRVGESILLGTEAVRREEIPGCHRDAFKLKAEVIEVLSKPSKPVGEIGQDAFGRIPVYEDLGTRRRAIAATGRQDVDPDSLYPIDPGIRIVGASSDHLILDVTEAEHPVEPGDVVQFLVQYGTLLRASTSAYVEKVVV